MLYRLLCALCFLSLFLGCQSESHRAPTYYIARDSSWYSIAPFGKTAAIFGFSDELIYEIATDQALSIKLYEANWDTLREGLLEDQWDAMLTSLPNELPYTARLRFSEPYLLLGDVLVARKMSDLSTLAQLGGREVGVLKGSSAIVLLAREASIIIKTYDTPPQLLIALAQGSIDAALLPNLVAHGFVQDLFSHDFKIVSQPLTPQALYLIDRKETSPELIDHFNAGLLNLKKNGIYQKLLAKWNLQ